MSIPFDLIDIIIIVGICQGIFLSLTLRQIANNNKKANAILSLLIIISTLMLIGRFLMIRAFDKWVFLWSLLFDIVIFLFGPLFYLYTKRLLLKGEKVFHLSKYHYSPAIIYSFVALGYIFYYNPETYLQAYRDGELTVLFNILLIIGLGLNFFYLFKSFTVLKEFKIKEKQRFSFNQNPIKYVFFFLTAITLILMGWLIGYINSQLLSFNISFLSYDAIWVAIPVFIYVIGYFSLKQPELFRVPVENKHKKQKRDRLSETEQMLLQKKLDSLMYNEKIFLQPDLTLSDISEKLQTSTNNVSWLLNNVYKTTFYDFINEHRVKEFILKVQNKEHLQHTILALSMDIGFNSKSAFNRAFKNTMNDTPSNYIKRLSAA